jgi:hypothetical protein
MSYTYNTNNTNITINNNNNNNKRKQPKLKLENDSQIEKKNKTTQTIVNIYDDQTKSKNTNKNNTKRKTYIDSIQNDSNELITNSSPSSKSVKNKIKTIKSGNDHININNIIVKQSNLYDYHFDNNISNDIYIHILSKYLTDQDHVYKSIFI